MVFTHFRAPYAFMGYQCPLAESRVVVIPVPYDATTSFGGGARNGPHAIITASRQVEFYDLELKDEVAFRIGMHTTDEVEPDSDSPQKTIARVSEVVAEVLEKGKFPVVLGGEHSVSLGPVSALTKKYPKLSVLQLDAHGDLRDSYEGSRYNHACVMRRVRETVKGPVVQVGVRSMDKSEAEYIQKNRLQDYVFGTEFDSGKIAKLLSDDVYITIDLDAFDPCEVPGVGTPEPGGLRWAQVLPLLRSVCSKKNVVGFDINELVPIPNTTQSEFLAAKLAYKLLCYKFGAR